MGLAAFMRQVDLDCRRSASAVDDFCNVATSDEAQEGLRAFVEKRPPNGEAGSVQAVLSRVDDVSAGGYFVTGTTNDLVPTW